MGGDPAVSILEGAGVALAPGLSGADVESVRTRFGFGFARDHLQLLTEALPVGPRWPDWRAGGDNELKRMVDWPVEGIVWDVLNEQNRFWPASWGPRPADAIEIEQTARAKLAIWPKLAPIHSHRYLPAAPAPGGSPVFSVHQTDVIYYGPDLVEYLRCEFTTGAMPRKQWTFRTRVPYWSQLVEAAGRAELM